MFADGKAWVSLYLSFICALLRLKFSSLAIIDGVVIHTAAAGKPNKGTCAER